MNNQGDLTIFSIVPIDVLADRRLKLNHFRVLVALLSFRNKATNLTCPSRETLSARCGLPITRISAITADLVAFGWLKKEGKGGYSKATRYEITVPDLSELNDTTVTETVTVDDTTTVTETVTLTVTETVTPTVTETVTRIVTDNITNNITDNTVRATPSSENAPATPAQILTRRLLAQNVQATGFNPYLLAWLEEKISDEMIENCVQLAKFEKPTPEPIPMRYLNTIIRREIAKNLRPKKPDKSWRAFGNNAGIDAMAREHKITCPRNITDYQQFADYLEKIIAERQRNGSEAVAA